MAKYKTITQEQIDEWQYDEEHGFYITMPAKHLVDWFYNLPTLPESPACCFERYEDMVLIEEPCPVWWTECDENELYLAVLRKLFLKEEWIDRISISRT